VVKLHADAALYAGLFDGEETATLTIAPGRKAYVHLIRGALHVNGLVLATGDAALLENEPTIHLTHGQAAEVLVFDLTA
jgi:redox-sensitive bicupin YhaK (pirin superfamily)